jgi:PAS domain S-box-containing protein
MTPSQRQQYQFESATDSVMTRTLEGIINFWNRAAEDLYGWRKEEVVGRRSHDVLQTQFPKPLKEIETELLRRGRWEGQLVHTTRTGDRVVVASRWTLADGQSGAVVEINAYSGDPNTSSKAQKDDYGPRMSIKQAMRLPGYFRGNATRLFTWVGILSIIAVWIGYTFLGHPLIDLAYNNQASFPFVDQIMQGKAFTPVESYHRAADEIMIVGTAGIVILYFALVFLLQHPAGALLASASFLLSSFFFFCFFEMFPSLIKPLGLDAISYYAYKTSYLDDNELIYREKPFNYFKQEDFRSEHYSSAYGIQVPPVTFEWITDANGFRNSSSRKHSDLVVVGYSYVEWGNTEADTFVKRLESKLPGLTATNLGKSGYGPPQYTAVMKRYGAEYKPKYALLAFFEGNDIENTQAYFRWKAGQRNKLPEFPYRMTQLSFFERYWLALQKKLALAGNAVRFGVEMVLNDLARRQGYAYDVHPDLAVLDVGQGEPIKMLFVEKLSGQSPDQMLASPAWKQLRTVLADFHDLCEEQGIVPIIIYIPAAAHVYAQYSTEQSGANWLAIREQQIAAKKNTEEALTRLTRELKFELISLSPAFEEAAKKGKVLYYSLDPHWNEEGTDLAASYVAGVLKSKYLPPPSATSH